jgi:hypothetical protein
MTDGQKVLIESDGDVSLVSQNKENSIQTEVKSYSDSLTDHHENFWKTLHNWLAPDFDHENYSLLILHTTQAFGKTTLLKDWHDKNAEERLLILDQICSEREFDSNTNYETLNGVAKLQFQVMSKDRALLKAVVSKILLNVESMDLESMRGQLLHALDGYIPKANQQAYLEGLIGFVYEQSTQSSWEITRERFVRKKEVLTAQYSLRTYTVPKLNFRDATDEELEDLAESTFVRKINEIEYEEVLPEAVGNWLELQNSLSEELEGFPQYRQVASDYQGELISVFRRKYRSACRKSGDCNKHSKDLYDEVTTESPRGLDGYPTPSLVFKNGLIHDAMDDEELKLKWKVDNE